MVTKDEAKREIRRLVDLYLKDKEKWQRIKETETRSKFIDPMLKALGWDFDSIDEVQIYNRALSGSEIALLASGGFADATGWNQDAQTFSCSAGIDFDSHIYQYKYNNASSYNLYAAMEYVGPNTGNTWRQTDISTPFPQPPTSYSCYNYKIEP